MCGIAGILGPGDHKEDIHRMLEVQAHRGPDFRAVYEDKGISLGHNRLSIIDLSDEANQPFFSPDKRYVLVYNGEIYNYIELRKELSPHFKFRTKSDTEVLLAAYLKWGEDCLDRFVGMFSFAIWDSKKHEIFAARDRFGVKPFYYSEHGDSFYFASEIKGLLAAGIKREPNQKVWANYFCFGSYGKPDETFWSGIHQLPGGYKLKKTRDGCEINKWYDFEDEVAKVNTGLSHDELISRYTELLEESINLRFRADVPVGFNVSGGLDSSTLLTFVNRTQNNKNIKAFTFYTGDERYDETPWVEELISITGNPLIKVRLSAEDVPELSEQMSLIQEEPHGGVPTLAYAKLFTKAREHGVKVLLDGQGMDEQWAGYDYYFNKTGHVIQGVKSSPFCRVVLDMEMLELAEKPNYPKPFDDGVLDMQYRDLFYTKIPRALRFNDRVSMAASTELREPFLDHRLVALAFAQPEGQKIKDGKQKYLLRELVAKYLSDSIRYAPKRPLQTPQREWLGADLRDWVISEVDSLKRSSWFNGDILEQQLKAYFNGDQQSSFHIWQWINTAQLLKQPKIEHIG